MTRKVPRKPAVGGRRKSPKVAANRVKRATVPGPGPNYVNPDARAEAMRLLSTGMYVGDVARQMRRNRHTIRKWRDTPEGQKELAEARANRVRSFDALAEARTMLLDLAPFAVQALAEDLRIGGKRGAAARDILDRIGVLRGTEVHIKPSIDLSKLSPQARLDAHRAAQGAT